MIYFNQDRNKQTVRETSRKHTASGGKMLSIQETFLLRNIDLQVRRVKLSVQRYFNKNKKMQKNKISKRVSLFTEDTADNVTYEDYGSSAIQSLVNHNETISEAELDEKAKHIFQWAKKKGALYYTFLCFPRSGGVSQKQQTFLNLNYFFSKSAMNSQGNSYFSTSHLLKGEADGSSFPSGGLRQTCKARAYTVWDIKSDILFRNRNKTLYIPALLVSHLGHALDDKALFRTCEGILSKSVKGLLEKIGVENSGTIMALGLEQQFFAIPREAYLKRVDIRTTGRALVGQLPAKHQQFSDHYYGKIPHEVENILKEVEDELLELGVPVKTRHNEVAINQFEFCPLFLEAGKTIDQNMMLMEILKEAFARRGYEVLLHEKPFLNMNGSGKHHNWSLNYVDKDGKIVNLFKIPKAGQDPTLFKLFVLINLAAVANNNKLYMGAIGTNGNELRLGGHEAPPRIISVFCGSAVSDVIDNKDPAKLLNLKETLPNVTYDLYQEDTDRNRTSPYAYTGNKFEVRAAGSSQNPSFIMATIAATIASEVNKVKARLDNGQSLESIMADLHAKTKNIRFDGNGYSQEWPIEAEKRGLYVNKKFSQILTSLPESSKVFVEVGALEQKQVIARSQVMIDNYVTCVATELDAMIQIYNKHIIPRCIDHSNKNNSSLPRVKSLFQNFEQAFDHVLEAKEKLDQWQAQGIKSIELAQEVRDYLWEAGVRVDKVSRFLPRDQGWPEWDEFLFL